MNINQLFEQFVGGDTHNAARPGTSQASQHNEMQHTGTGGVADLLGKFTGGSSAGGAAGIVGGLAAGGLLGTLMGSKKMRKKVGKIAGGAVGYGGSAVLGAVALKAFQNWQSKGTTTAPAAQPVQSAAQLPGPEAFDPALNQDASGQPFQLALVKSMIAAANADGHIDKDEQAAVFDAVDKMSLDGEAKAMIFDVLRKPPELAEIASYATGMEQASEIYLASRLAIDPDQPSEQAYLDELSRALGLPNDLVMEIEMQLAPEPVATANTVRASGTFGR